MQDQSLLKEPKTESSEDSNEMVVSVQNSEHDANQPVRMRESPDPPIEITYKNIFDNLPDALEKHSLELRVVEECEQPLIDLKQLSLGDVERQACKKLISRTSQEWGFLQVINSGISSEVLAIMREVKLFKKSFHKKKTYKDLYFLAGSYRWGTPSATCLKELSWSEAFHVNSSIEQFVTAVSQLAQKLADILAEEMDRETCFFKEKCLPSSSYLRLNRYPPCPLYNQMAGIISHTDSDFLTVLHQDTNVGGMQLMKHGKWFAVKPDSEALIINIGDLFQTGRTIRMRSSF